MTDRQEGAAEPGAGSQDARPRPAYGEYAPEGWSWTPPGAENEADGSGGAAQGTRPDGTSRASGVPAGVPHNLGARGEGGTAAQAPAAPPSGTATPGSGKQDPPPYRADEPANARREQQPVAAPLAAQGAAPAKPRPRTADRVITILLLVVGAFGALNMAAPMFALEAQVQLMGTMLGIEDLNVPSWIATAGLIAGLGILLVYALNVIYSIQRMRGGKLAFWVPLAAFGIAFVIMLVVQMVAMYNAPEIIEQLNSDPYGSYGKMMQYLEETSVQ